MSNAHKKPAGYQAHIPFPIAFWGNHRRACRQVWKLHQVNRLEVEILAGMQYALQLAARDMLGVTSICELSGRGVSTSRRKYLQRILDELVEKRCLQVQSLGKRGTLYGFQPFGIEVLRYYQRQLYHAMGLMEHQEKLTVKYKYFTLEELPASALDKGRGR